MHNQNIFGLLDFIKDDKFESAIIISKLQFEEAFKHDNHYYYGMISKEFDENISEPEILKKKEIDIDNITDKEFIICFSNFWYLDLLNYYNRIECYEKKYYDDSDFHTDIDELCNKIIDRVKIINEKYKLFKEVFKI